MAEGSKTEKATPKRRRDERKKGNVFLSKDAVSVATLLGAYGVILIIAAMFIEELASYMIFCFTSTGGTEAELRDLFERTPMQFMAAAAKTFVPIIAISVIAAIAATFAQTRFLVSLESLKPKFNRISPLQGFKRLFSLRSIVEAVKGIIKISILMVIIFISIQGMIPDSPRYLYTDVAVSCRHIFDVSVGMLMRVIIAFIALAVFDFAYQWWEYERQLKMSKQEIKEEYKQMEGDPQIKAKVREIQRKRAQMRMMQQVPQSDVVIRNPTHFAVALRYRPEQDAAPIVLAKGQDEVALRIMKVAEEHGVAVIENVPLARALYAGTELNQEIAPEFYTAVAEVLVLIFRLNEKKQIVTKRR